MAVTWNVALWFSSVEKAAVVVNAGAVLSCASTVTVTVWEAERVPAPSSVAMSVSMTVWAASVASGAVQVVSSALASAKEPPPSLVQA